MGEIDLKKELCRKHCAYYRPSKGRGLACQGLRVIERLIKNGRISPFNFNEYTKSPDVLTEKKLLKKLCKVCPFYEDDCDYVKKKKAALPCGGFVLLRGAMQENAVVIEDLKA